jgi:hypothetical protein
METRRHKYWKGSSFLFEKPFFFQL